MPKLKESTGSVSLLDALVDRSGHQAFSDIAKRKSDLQDRLNREEQQESELLVKLGELRSVSTVDALADALMGDPEANMKEVEGVREQLGKTRLTQEAIRRAVDKLNHESMQLSAELDAQDCRAVAPLHRRNVRATLNAMLGLHRATVAQQLLREQLNRRGVERTSHLRPMSHFDFENGLNDPHSWLSATFREAVEWKIITEAERVELLRGTLDELSLEG